MSLVYQIFLLNHPVKIFSVLLLTFYGSYKLTHHLIHKNYLRFIYSGLISLLATLCIALFSTALGKIPEDWSALRIAVPLYLINGHHLYADTINDPTTCFIYLPVGAWIYIPVAFFGMLTKSVSFCLSAGWIETVFLYYLPIIILLLRWKTPLINKLLIALISVILTFSSGSLKYISTIVHVDVVGISMAATSIALLIPGVYLKKPSRTAALISGCALALSFFTKQTFVPINGLLLFIIIFYFRDQSISFFYKSFLITFIILCAAVILTERLDLIWIYCFQSAMGLSSVKKIQNSFFDFIKINYPVLISALCCTHARFTKQAELPKETISMVCIVAVACASIPLGLYSYTKSGADVNHFALSTYLLLFSVIICLIPIVQELNKYPNRISILILIVIISLPYISSYLKSNCGAYLWVNNPHVVAEKYCLMHGFDKVYFPWQPLAPLLSKKPLHIEQGFFYEDFTNMPTRSSSNYLKYLPAASFKIAVRPFGDPSYLTSRFNLTELKQGIPELPGWRIYQCTLPLQLELLPR